MSQITIQNLYFTYDGDHTPVFEDLNLQLDTNWKLGLVGRNGRGKTTLLRLLAGELEALCGAEGIRRAEEDSWLDLELSEGGWEDQLEALADFLETCNGRHPYDCSLPMRRLLCLRVGPEGGNRWSGWIYDVDAEAYGLERERFLQNLGKDPDEEPPPPVPEDLPPMEVHYGDRIILDGDEVIVVNRAEEPEEKSVPFDGRVEEEERFRGSAALESG